ncbi:MAG TPA: hypothetical protein VK589_06135 [Chryseolinea sp.]|nr:hypothetical protein [Chryseolinea sp.]
MKTLNKPIYHGYWWLINRAILFIAIGILSVWGIAYISIPIFAAMRHVDRQAAALILSAGLIGALGLVWLYSFLTGKL